MNRPHELAIVEKAGHTSALFNWDESVPIMNKTIEFLKKNLGKVIKFFFRNFFKLKWVHVFVFNIISNVIAFFLNKPHHYFKQRWAFCFWHLL